MLRAGTCGWSNCHSIGPGGRVQHGWVGWTLNHLLYAIHGLITMFYSHIHFSEGFVKVLAAQLCPTLCDPLDCSLPGSSVHGILQARILEGVTISFSRGSSRPGNQTWVSCTVGRFFTNWATREALRHSAVKIVMCRVVWPVRPLDPGPFEKRNIGIVSTP